MRILCIAILSLLFNVANAQIATKVVASDGTNTDRVIITWTGPSNNYYAVFRSNNKAGSGLVQISPYNKNMFSYGDATAAPDKTYYYSVRASADAAGIYSQSDSGYIFAPNITATKTYTAGVLVSFVRPPGNFVKVYRSSTNEASTAQQMTKWIKDNGYQDISAKFGQSYYYWVKMALDTSGTSSTAYSPVAEGWVAAFPAFNVVAMQGYSQDYIRITWNGVWNFHRMIFRNTVDNFETATPLLTKWLSADVSYDDATAVPGTSYYYYIVEGNYEGKYRSVPAKSATYGYRKTGSPTSLTASKGTFTDRIRLTCVPFKFNPGGYYQFYVGNVYDITKAKPISDWQSGTTFDYFVKDKYTYYFWVRSSASPTGANPGTLSAYDQGYKK